MFWGDADNGPTMYHGSGSDLETFLQCSNVNRVATLRYRALREAAAYPQKVAVQAVVPHTECGGIWQAIADSE